MSSILALCFSFFLFSSTITAFNITKILSNQSDFSNFNDMLTKTQLASTINSRQTITILAIDNANIAPLSSQPLDAQKKILTMHVVLDYYDDLKLKNLPNKSEIMTTLYQSSGQAKGEDGFLNATLINGQVSIGSAAPGSSLNAKLVKPVMTQPYNVSILQISSVIMPSNSSVPPSSSPAPGPAVAPSMAPAPAPGPTGGQAPSPSEAPSPTGSSPGTAPEAPAADAPMSSPPAMGPAADGPAADDPNNGVTCIAGNRIAVFVMVWFSFLSLVKMI